MVDNAANCIGVNIEQLPLAIKKQLAVIIVNYKTPGLVLDAIHSVLPELDGINAQVIIVDNNSGDGSIASIQQWILDNDVLDAIRLIELRENIGFSGGNNIGILGIDAEFYLLLNSDTVVRPGAIALLLSAARTNPCIGIVSPRLEWPDGEAQVSCFSFHRPLSELIRASGTGAVTSLLKPYDVPRNVLDHETSPEWTSFACVLVRKAVFNNIGLLDDSFFMYFEDVEFCYRMKQASWTILNEPKAKVVHLRGGSSSVKTNTICRKRLPKYYYESRTKYFYKCFGYSGLLLANVSWILGRSISLFREISGTKKPHLCNKEWLDIWTNFANPNQVSVMLERQEESNEVA